ncbi:hypothetical protein [Amycolatopsis sp. NPDC004378]
MRRTGAWTGGATAVACAVMAIDLSRSDLHDQSWLGGAGSFVTGVSALTGALVLAVPARPRPVPVAAVGAERDPTVVPLTTPSSRIRHRAVGVLTGVVWLGVFLAVAYLGGASLGAVLPLVLLAVFALAGFWDAHADGKDELILDPAGMTIVDRRRIAVRDRSFRVRWADLESVALQARRGRCCVAVRYGKHGGWDVVLELPSESPELLYVVRRALERFAGGKFRD